MTEIKSAQFFYPHQRLQFNSPTRTYLYSLFKLQYFFRKTNDIKKRELLHQSVVAKLTNAIQCQRQTNKKTIKINNLINRRSSSFNPQQIDRNQQLWDVLKSKIEDDKYDQELMKEFLTDILRSQNYLINIEKYQFQIKTKQEFTRLKHLLILLLLNEPNFMRYLMKIESIRLFVLPNTTTMLQDIKGFQGTNKLITKLIFNLQQDITLAVLIEKYDPKNIKHIFQDIATHILQPQDDNMKLYYALREFSETHQLNHVHFTNFKYTFYKLLMEFEIKERTIKKLMKSIDYFKPAIMRCERIKDLLNRNQQLYLYQMVSDRKNSETQKRQIELLLQYILNNHQRFLKKDDIKLMNISEIRPQVLQVINNLDPNKLLVQDVAQDLNACFNTQLHLKQQQIDKFCKHLCQVPFFLGLYKENEVIPKNLINLEIDFMLNNRNYFRQREIQLIHKRFHITNEIFDLYVYKIQECLVGVPLKVILNRINSYRDWIVQEL